MNSSIQCLFHLNQFVNFILNNRGKPLVTSTRNLLIIKYDYWRKKN